jgi:hypothetical protein
MSKFVPSTFLVGVAASWAFSFAVHERMEQRKYMFIENHEDELVAYYYQQKLKEKMYLKQNKADNPTIRDLKNYINHNIVPGVVEKVDSAFAVDIKKTMLSLVPSSAPTKTDEKAEGQKSEQKSDS